MRDRFVDNRPSHNQEVLLKAVLYESIIADADANG